MGNKMGVFEIVLMGQNIELKGVQFGDDKSTCSSMSFCWFWSILSNDLSIEHFTKLADCKEHQMWKLVRDFRGNIKLNGNRHSKQNLSPSDWWISNGWDLLDVLKAQSHHSHGFEEDMSEGDKESIKFTRIKCLTHVEVQLEPVTWSRIINGLHRIQQVWHFTW